jgi:hypothetical protein
MKVDAFNAIGCIDQHVSACCMSTSLPASLRWQQGLLQAILTATQRLRA